MTRRSPVGLWPASSFLGTSLAIGLGTRLAAAALFVFNIVAVISYPELEGAGLDQHYVWGILLAVTLVHGPGLASLDRLVSRFFRMNLARSSA